MDMPRRSKILQSSRLCFQRRDCLADRSVQEERGPALRGSERDLPWVIDRFGYAPGLLDVRDRLLESSKLGQAHSELSARRHNVAIGEVSAFPLEKPTSPGRGINCAPIVAT